MQEREVRLLFEKGHLTRAQVVPDVDLDGWNVLLRGDSHSDTSEVLSAKRGGPRVFKTSDAAITWCHEIGFKTVIFKLDSHMADASRSTSGACKSILLVEDNEDDVLLTRRAFRKRNLDSLLVVKRDGKEALDFLFADANEDSSSDLPCLVLLDLKLPKLNGFDVLREIRNCAATRSIPVIILSSSQESQDVKRGYDLGTNSYLRKPTTQDNFEVMVEHIEEYWLHLNVPPPESNAL